MKNTVKFLFVAAALATAVACSGNKTEETAAAVDSTAAVATEMVDSAAATATAVVDSAAATATTAVDSAAAAVTK